MSNEKKSLEDIFLDALDGQACEDCGEYTEDVWVSAQQQMKFYERLKYLTKYKVVGNYVYRWNWFDGWVHTGRTIEELDNWVAIGLARVIPLEEVFLEHL